ncbi:MAG TPA: response regulator [Polyangiaceae bacterium]|jgi:DNA-binding response OmpR family regulator|nr:response regulator [Polyangiaceae bacterium]
MGRVLLVDDDPTVLFMLTEMLRDAGHEVLAADTSAGALSLSTDLDAALVDLNMHGECGQALIARLRERQPALPVILLTGQARQLGAVDDLSAGVELMHKPLDIDELAQVLNRALLGGARPQPHRTSGTRPWP